MFHDAYFHEQYFQPVYFHAFVVIEVELTDFQIVVKEILEDLVVKEDLDNLAVQEAADELKIKIKNLIFKVSGTRLKLKRLLGS